MADSDPISDATPYKRRKIDHEPNHAKAWDSQDEDAEDLTPEDFETQPTLPLPPAGTLQKKLQYTSSQFRNDYSSVAAPVQSSIASYITQPTQTVGRRALHTQSQAQLGTQPTQLFSPRDAPLPNADVLVERSSPPVSPPKSLPPPSKALFSRPRGGLLASSIAPQGTGFRAPLGVQHKPPAHAINVDDSDDEPDPPVDHSSDEGGTQGLKSNIKPTNFKNGGRGLDSTPNRTTDTTVPQSPHASTTTSARPAGDALERPRANTVFSSLMADFTYSNSSAPRSGDDMASAYSSRPRPPRPHQPQRQTGPARAQPVSAVRYQTLADIEDFSVRQKVQRMQSILPGKSIQLYFDALSNTHWNQVDAMALLVAGDEEKDELTLNSPAFQKRGQAVPVAKPKTQPSSMSGASSQPLRPSAKQQVKAPSRTIAEKHAAAQADRRPMQAAARALESSDSEDDDVKPKRGRLVQHSKAVRSPSPSLTPYKTGQPTQRLQKKRPVITIDDDDDDDRANDEAFDSSPGDAESEGAEELQSSTAFDDRLLKFLNECTVRDLAELCAEPEDAVKFVLDHRPFVSLDAVRAITNAPATTKSGKKSRSRPVGDKIVDISSEMWSGYEAVDELVEECDRIAKPIQQVLKGWGVGESGGELQLMNLEEAHDSGIGTPASSYTDDQPTPKSSKTNKAKAKFLGQPENMGEVVMKDYQLVGLNWLKLLWSKKISCILADDMGLGKTCQVIAFLAQLQREEVDGVHLVIVPGATLENWLREFARFAPSLNVVPYYGGQAERKGQQVQIEDDFGTIDVVVTTYDMTRQKDDNAFLRGLHPAVCVYDEAHALRNPNSLRYSQLTRIKADFKVLLTGTPLQNNLQELIAILAFIMPDLFQGKREQLDYIFKHKASTKDADHVALLSAERIARARTMMTPFILRRKKHQVLDLPVKHRRVEWCDMTASQAAYYTHVLTEAQQLFAEKATGKAKKGQSAKASSNILMALRKAAIQPLLSRRLYTEKKIDRIQSELLKHDEFGSNAPDKVRAYLTGEAAISLSGGDFGLHRFCAEREYLHKMTLKKKEWMDSGKVAKFQELVTAYKANGDRLLVFSQFTTMMDILEAVLETLAVKFMRLDGSTRMDTRQDMIDQFTADTSITVFMLSTKAGGAGINLASANKVIIFDSGFNPQDDIQAENRAHRVGQTREVEVVRLVTRGTIEEQIHALGESKLALDERVAGEGAATPAEEREAEKSGEQMVEQMLMQSLQGQPEDGRAGPGAGGDLKDAFKSGMEGAGMKIASKQARF